TSIRFATPTLLEAIVGQSSQLLRWRRDIACSRPLPRYHREMISFTTTRHNFAGLTPQLRIQSNTFSSTWFRLGSWPIYVPVRWLPSDHLRYSLHKPLAPTLWSHRPNRTDMI